jgi:hypothetical protein
LRQNQKSRNKQSRKTGRLRRQKRTRITEKTKSEKEKQAKQEDRKAKKAEEKEEKKDELGENCGNNIQEHTKRTRSHKGDEEKKPAAKKSNYSVEKNRASERWICTVASLGAKQSVRASDSTFPQNFLIPSKLYYIGSFCTLIYIPSLDSLL